MVIETETLSIAIEKLLSESNDNNRRTIYKAKFFKLFCDEDVMIDYLRRFFYSEPDKNQYYVYTILSGLEYDSKRYHVYCELLIEKGFSPPQPPVDYNKIEHEGLQKFFNALFSQEKFQELINELILELNDNTLTYDNVNEKFFDHFAAFNSVQKEKLQNVVWCIKFAKFEDRNIKNFVAYINNWNDFCITNVVNILLHKNQNLIISDKQEAIIVEYCRSIDIDEVINNEIKEEAVSSIKFSHRALYFCFLSKYFNIKYNIDTHKKMTLIPKEMFKDDSHDNQAFPDYISVHLTETELNECVKNNLENCDLCIHSIISHIQYCKIKHLMRTEKTLPTSLPVSNK